MENKRETPQQKYRKKHVKRFYIECVDTTEKDIIDKLLSEERYASYIKRLIREDIEKSSK